MFLSVERASAAAWHGNYFPNVALITQDGKTVHFYDDLLKNKKVVINFMYTACGDSCPLETARLSQVRKALGNRLGQDVFFYSISLDPKRDTPAALKAYANKFHVGPGWLFLTGAKADIELVRKKLGQGARADENELTSHSTSLMIGNEATGEWIRDSSLDNPNYIAAIIGTWLSEGRNNQNVKSYAQAPPVPEYVADKGGYLFHSRCSACHTIGEGDGIGPDLRGVTKARNRAWLAHFIAAPNEALAKKDPLATALFKKYNEVLMPNLRLNETDVQALIGYLDAQSTASRADSSHLKKVAQR